MLNVAVLTPILQTLLTATADDLARQAGFARGRRGLTGADFLQTLTFGFRKRKNAPLQALARPPGLSRQGPHQRLPRPAPPWPPAGALPRRLPRRLHLRLAARRG